MLSIFFIIACNEKDEAKKILAELKVDARYTNTSSYWAFLSAPSGELLASDQLFPGSSVIFETTSSIDYFNVTILTYAPKGASPIDYYSAITYSELSVGSTVNVTMGDIPSFFTAPSIGVANVDIIGNEDVLSYGFFLTSKHMLTGVTNSQIPGGVRYACGVKVNPTEIFVSGYRGGIDPVYKSINNVIPGLTSTVNLSEFIPFSQIVEVSVPELTWVSAVGLNPNAAGIILSSRFQNTSGIVKLGILGGFDSYEFMTSRFLSNGRFIHLKTSTVPMFSPKPLVDPAFSIENPIVNEFKFSISATPDYASHSWGSSIANRNVVFWNVIAPRTSFPRINEVAMAIKEKYPEFDSFVLKHNRSSFFFRHDGSTYADYIKSHAEFFNKPNQEYTVREYSLP